MSKTSLMQSVCAAIAALALGTFAAQAGVDISTKATQNMSCANGVCSPTAKKAVLNVNDLTNMLAAGDLKITTGAGALDVHVKAPFSWTNTSRLTLDAMRSVTIEKAVVVAGSGALTLTTNDGGTGGDYWFPNGGSVTFWDLNSSLIINGQTFTLVKDIKTLAADITNNPSGFYALTNNYDASADGTYSSSPISSAFMGTLDGLGNTISNLVIKNRAPYQNIGLLSQIGAYGQKGGTVRDLRISKGHVQGGGKLSIVGILAGENFGLVFGDTVSGRIAGKYVVGGIAGANSLIIKDSVSTAAVTGIKSRYGGFVGGIVGVNAATISNSHAAGRVTNVSDDFGTTGGLAGDNYGTIISSFATGAVTGGINSGDGGLVGAQGGTIANCYSTGSVTGGTDGEVGGLIGVYAYGQVGPTSSSYSTGEVTGGAGSYLGGFIGFDSRDGTISDAYWDTDTSGVIDPSQGAGNVWNDPGITGLTDVQLKAALPDGFDPNVWGQDPNINNGYPYLLANPPPNGNKAAANSKKMIGGSR